MRTIFKLLWESAKTPHGLLGWLVVLGKPIAWLVGTLGDVEFLIQSWPKIAVFFESGVGTLATVALGTIIIGTSILSARKRVLDPTKQNAEVAITKDDPTGTRERDGPNNETPFVFDSEHFSKSVFVYSAELESKKLSGRATNIIATFNIFNGSGFPIQIDEQIKGRATMDAVPLFGELEQTSGSWRSIQYPGHGRVLIRQFLSEEEIQEGKEKAERPEVQHLETMFGGDPRPPGLDINFSDVQVMAHAVQGDSKITFLITMGMSFVRVTY